MLRVAKQAIFISDSNNFGQGRTIVRMIKQTINLFGLWRACDLLRTTGKGFHFSEGDGVYYSYSVFNNYRQIRSCCEQVHLFDTSGTGSVNLYRSAPHVAVLGIKRGPGPK